MAKSKTKAQNFKSLAENLDTANLVDEIGTVMAVIADFDKKKKAFVTELLARAGNRSHIDGNLYTATIIAEHLAVSLDVAAVKKEMGDEWVAARSVESVKKASVRVAARKTEQSKEKKPSKTLQAVLDVDTVRNSPR